MRGDTIGRGSFGTVSLAIPINNYFSLFPNPIVVKSSEFTNSGSIRNEKEVLSQLGNNHPHIIHFFGHSISLSSAKGAHFYNLFLELAGKGSLADHLRFSGGKFESCDVKRYTESILKGLSYIHQQGFVHCDIKLQNILLFDHGVAKIADFGLAKRVLEKETGCQLRGTPLYMSPEIVAGGEVGSPADIWALGCSVVEMVSGKPAWNCSPECDVSALLYKIGVTGESPEIPGNLCHEGKDFLQKCFAKDPKERWTARMLLDHPFLSGFSDQPASISPRCPFEFSEWESIEESSSSTSMQSFDPLGFANDFEISGRRSVFEQLGSEEEEVVPHWSDEDGWVNVR